MLLTSRNITMDYIHVGNSRLYKGPKMSEEERNEKHIASRIVYIIAIVAGMVTFLCGLLTIPLERLITNYFPTEFFEADIELLIIIGVFFLWVWFWRIAAICLVPSIIALLIKRDKRFRLLPLAFVMVGMLLHTVFNIVFYGL